MICHSDHSTTVVTMIRLHGLPHSLLSWPPLPRLVSGPLGLNGYSFCMTDTSYAMSPLSFSPFSSLLFSADFKANRYLLSVQIIYYLLLKSIRSITVFIFLDRGFLFSITVAAVVAVADFQHNLYPVQPTSPHFRYQDHCLVDINLPTLSTG